MVYDAKSKIVTLSSGATFTARLLGIWLDDADIDPDEILLCDHSAVIYVKDAEGAEPSRALTPDESREIVDWLIDRLKSITF